jgi:hypothetical protein
MKLLNKHNLAVAKFASQEESRYAIRAVLITENETVATDGHMIARTTLPAIDAARFPEVPGFNVSREKTVQPDTLLPVDAARAIEKSLPKKETIPVLNYAAISAEGDNIVVAVTDLAKPQVSTIRKVEGSFPNWQAVFGAPGETEKEYEKRLERHQEWPPVFTGYLPVVADITIDAKLLKRLADYAVSFAGSKDGPQAVRLRVWTQNHALRFDMSNSDTGQECSGLIMPIRPDKDAHSYYKDPSDIKPVERTAMAAD